MNVLIVGSKSIHVSSFISALNKKGISPVLVAEESLDYEEIRALRVACFRSKNPLRILFNYLKLKSIFRKEKPTIVHIHQVNRLAYFVTRICFKKNIPCVVTAWGSDVLLIPQKNRFFKFLVKKTLQRANEITADSENMIAAMQLLEAKKEKYTLLQYGINLIESREKEKIIYSNRLHEPLYRIDKIIDYFNEFQVLNSDWVLVIGAIGSETESLKKKVNELGLIDKIKFIGWVNLDENTKMYQKSSIYISIPESDGTSVSLLEAMSAGCLPIVSDISVAHEWILNGKNGVIVDANENPIFKAVKMEGNLFENINRSLIESIAERGVCTNRFIDLYKKISC